MILFCLPSEKESSLEGMNLMLLLPLESILKGKSFLPFCTELYSSLLQTGHICNLSPATREVGDFISFFVSPFVCGS